MSAWKKTRKGFVCLSFCCCLNFFVTCVHFFFCAVVPDDGLERKMISIQNETENRFVNLSEALLPALPFCWLLIVLYYFDEGLVRGLTDHQNEWSHVILFCCSTSQTRVTAADHHLNYNTKLRFHHPPHAPLAACKGSITRRLLSCLLLALCLLLLAEAAATDDAAAARPPLCCLVLPRNIAHAAYPHAPAADATAADGDGSRRCASAAAPSSVRLILKRWLHGAYAGGFASSIRTHG